MFTGWISASKGQSWPTRYPGKGTWQEWLDVHEAEVKDEMATLPPGTGRPIKTTWSSGGVSRSVSTEWNGTESVDAWRERHFADVRAAMQVNPPDLS
jgi:hypothetical protein